MFSLCLRVKNQPLGKGAFFSSFLKQMALVCVCCGAGEGVRGWVGVGSVGVCGCVPSQCFASVLQVCCKCVASVSGGCFERVSSVFQAPSKCVPSVFQARFKCVPHVFQVYLKRGTRCRLGTKPRTARERTK